MWGPVSSTHFSVKNITKSILRRIAPHAFASVMAQRSNRYARRVLERDGVHALSSKFIEAHGLVVRRGPFRGMRYQDQAVGSVLIPKLIGCYEHELHAHLARLLTKPYAVVVDVGCAEGYYSVGTALQTPAETVVHAYDTDPQARRSCARLAGLNGVSGRVKVGAFCDAAELNRVLLGRALVICDCEGCELELLEPTKVPALRHTDLIVELHDLARPGITEAMSTRFRASHDVHLVDAVVRVAADYPELNVLDLAARAKAVSEYRSGPQQWAVMIARESS